MLSFKKMPITDWCIQIQKQCDLQSDWPILRNEHGSTQQDTKHVFQD